MEQNNGTAFQEQQSINTVNTDGYIATAYGVVSRSFVEKLIKRNRSKEKRSPLLIVSFVLFCVILVIVTVFTYFYYDCFIPDFPAGNSSYDDGFSYTPDDKNNNDDSTSDSDYSTTFSKTSDAGLGVIVSVLDSSKAQFYGINGGLVIVGIPDNSSFIGSDVREYDIITHAQGNEITSTTSLSAILNQHEVGDEFTVTITRFSDGFAESFDVTVTLINKNE